MVVVGATIKEVPKSILVPGRVVTGVAVGSGSTTVPFGGRVGTLVTVGVAGSVTLPTGSETEPVAVS